MRSYGDALHSLDSAVACPPSRETGRAVLARVQVLRCAPARCAGASGDLDPSCAQRAERSVGDGGRVLRRGLVLRVVETRRDERWLGPPFRRAPRSSHHKSDKDVEFRAADGKAHRA